MNSAVPEEVSESIISVPEEAVDGVHDRPEDVCQEAELGLGGGQQGEVHQGDQQEGGPGGKLALTQCSVLTTLGNGTAETD